MSNEAASFNADSGLAQLGRLALDLRWSWNHASDEPWKQLAPDLWARTHSPWVVLRTVSRQRVTQMRKHGEDPARDDIEASQLYDLLESHVTPKFYTRDENDIPRAWVTRVRESMARLTPIYSANRSVREYVERCYLPAAAAYRWLLAQGHDPRSIVVAGDSAGGNLALVTLQRIHAAGEPMPACAVLLSAGVDFTLSSRSMVTNEGSDPMFDLPALVAMRSFYAPPERYLDPGVSPLFGNFTGPPPLFFQVGSREILLDESTRAAARAQEAGVPVEVEIWENMGHVFQALPLPQAQAAVEHIARFVETHAGWSVGSEPSAPCIITEGALAQNLTS
jgi:alpha/beta hydrolase fold/Protein of unknown function (DUF3417)